MATSISLSGVQRDITADQGSSIKVDFALALASTPLDMTGYDVRLQIRQSFQSTTTLINCTLANGKIAWTNQVGGTFYLLLQPADTSSLRFSADSPDTLEGVYDLEIQSAAGFVTKPCRGSFTLNREVTR